MHGVADFRDQIPGLAGFCREPVLHQIRLAFFQKGDLRRIQRRRILLIGIDQGPVAVIDVDAAAGSLTVAGCDADHFAALLIQITVGGGIAVLLRVADEIQFRRRQIRHGSAAAVDGVSGIRHHFQKTVFGEHGLRETDLCVLFLGKLRLQLVQLADQIIRLHIIEEIVGDV